jgi:hypothetical protein
MPTTPPFLPPYPHLHHPSKPAIISVLLSNKSRVRTKALLLLSSFIVVICTPTYEGMSEKRKKSKYHPSSKHKFTTSLPMLTLKVAVTH